MPLAAGLRALRERDYRRYFAGTIVAQTGTWMQTVTQSWLVLELTGSPFRLGLIATLQSGPILLLSIFTGVLADRTTRRTLLFVTQATQACLDRIGQVDGRVRAFISYDAQNIIAYILSLKDGD